MKRGAKAVWEGSLKEGNGKISTDSAVLSNTQYSFKTRFEQGNGTNPEELIAKKTRWMFYNAINCLFK